MGMEFIVRGRAEQKNARLGENRGIVVRGGTSKVRVIPFLDLFVIDVFKAQSDQSQRFTAVDEGEYEGIRLTLTARNARMLLTALRNVLNTKQDSVDVLLPDEFPEN